MTNDARAKALLDRLLMGSRGLMGPLPPATFGLMGMPYPQKQIPPEAISRGLRSIQAGPIAQTQQGNIDIYNRPQAPNPDGGISTVRSMSFQDEDGSEVLIPTVAPNGRLLNSQEAVLLYRMTKKHLGKFKAPGAADRFAEALHQQQDKYFNPFARKP
jgi:hypothetical protein